MNQMKQSTGTSRRGFLKKSLYSAPAIMALGHLTPSMVYGADGSGGFATQQPLSAQEPVIVAGNTDPAPGGAGSGSGSGNTSGVIGTSTDGGSGSSSAGAGDGTQVLPTDNNQTN